MAFNRGFASSFESLIFPLLLFTLLCLPAVGVYLESHFSFESSNGSFGPVFGSVNFNTTHVYIFHRNDMLPNNQVCVSKRFVKSQSSSS